MRQILHPTAPALLSTEKLTSTPTLRSEGTHSTATEATAPPLPPELAALITESSQGTHVPPVTIAPAQTVTMVSPPSSEPFTSLRRSTRSTRGVVFKSTKYIDESHLTSIASLGAMGPYMSQLLAYLAEVSTCCDSGIENVIDHRVYAAKTHVVDPDSPTFHQAMHGKFAEEYVKVL